MDITAIHRLTIADLDDCLRLSEDREWLPEEHKWRLLFEFGDVYGLDAPDGGLAGAVVCTRYDGTLAAISMMLVAERFGRQGIGGALMRHAIEHTDASTFALTATDYGRPLYERVGFRTIGTVTKYSGEFRNDPHTHTSRPAQSGDLADIIDLDRGVFGADRGPLLTRLQTFGEQFRVIETTDGIAGFAGAWRNIDNTVIGPTVAPDADTALTLIAEVAAGVDGEIRLDLDSRHPQLISWALEHGFAQGSATAHMIYGADLPGDRHRLFTPVMVALG